MGVGRQQRGPFQGVRVKNSVKELLLHIRSHKQKAAGQATDDFKVALSFCFGTGVRKPSLLGLLFFAHLSPVKSFVDHKVSRTESICALLSAVFLSLSPVSGTW